MSLTLRQFDMNAVNGEIARLGALALCRLVGLDRARGNAKQARSNCPLCEGTGALSVQLRGKKMLWHCHAGCGGGDAPNLVMRVRGDSFVEAVKALSDIGTEQRTEPMPSSQRTEPIGDDDFHRVASFILERSPLAAHREASNYCKRLGLFEVVRDFWGAWPSDEAAQNSVIREAESLFAFDILRGSRLFKRQKSAEKWTWAFANPRHPLLIPWRSKFGELQTLQMRCIGQPHKDSPKVLWPRERGPKWPFGINDVIEDLDDLRITLEFVEGAKDCIARRIALYRRNDRRLVVGLSSATDSIRDEWKKWINGRSVSLALDADEAGQKAARRLAKEARESGAVRVFITNPKRKDWTELLESENCYE